MPFVTKDRREIIDQFGLDSERLPGGVQVGDTCYFYYAPMVRRWKSEPRWTTAHLIYEDMLFDIAHLSYREDAAYRLAWQVFFQLYVMPYELKKREENGDVE